MDITKDFKNNLLKRRELKLAIESPSNPGFENTKKTISEKFKTEVDNIAVKSLINNFGTNEFMIEAFIYDSKDHKDKIEPKIKPKKKAGQ